jgi:hypothetical protein
MLHDQNKDFHEIFGLSGGACHATDAVRGSHGAT